jgi:hypothetical protein
MRANRERERTLGRNRDKQGAAETRFQEVSCGSLLGTGSLYAVNKYADMKGQGTYSSRQLINSFPNRPFPFCLCPS